MTATERSEPVDMDDAAIDRQWEFVEPLRAALAEAMRSGDPSPVLEKYPLDWVADDPQNHLDQLKHMASGGPRRCGRSVVRPRNKPEWVAEGCGRVLASVKFGGRETCEFCVAIRRRYGLEYREFLGMLEEQGFACAIESCSQEVSLPDRSGKGRGPRGTHIDHKPGMDGDPRGVRGILCGGCNRALMDWENTRTTTRDKQWRDDADSYLKKHGLLPGMVA